MHRGTIKAARWAITIFLLIIVWNHAHWSVALCLTFIFLAIEGIASAVDIINKALTAHIKLQGRPLSEAIISDDDEA